MEIEGLISVISDPRDDKNKTYSLLELILVVFSSVISGYDTPRGMAGFAKLKIEWLRKFGSFEKGTPSPETLRFFLCAINPKELISCFHKVFKLNEINCNGDHISIDGKTMRGTRTSKEDAIHVISAWSTEHGITLAALESKGKKNEIKTIPDVIDILEVENATISIDAMGCQREIASKIIDSNNDYVLQLKANQGSLLEQVEAFHHCLVRTDFKGIEHGVFEEVDKGHGRLEIRNYTQFALTDWIDGKSNWKGLSSAIMVERTREIKGQVTKETSWYISSLGIDAKEVAKSVRNHWGVENKLHWRLDVVFRDDQCALHSAAGPLNLSVIKRFCMNLLSKNNTIKGLKHKVMAAAVDDSFREGILFG